MHELGSTVGSNCEGNMLERVHNQDAVIRERLPEHRNRRLVLNHNSHPTLVEPADE